MAATLFETTADLRSAALQRAGEVTDGTSDYHSIALEQMNNLYRSLYAGGLEFDVTLGEVWDWAKAPSPGLLKLEPALEAGTVSLTLDSTSGTLSSAPAAALGSLNGWFLYITNESIVYRISAHTAGATAITLDQAYMGATGATKAYRLVKLDYELTADQIERLVQTMRAFTLTGNDNKPHEIAGIDAAALDRNYPLVTFREGIPTSYAQIANANGTITVRFNSCPADATRVEYEYIPVAPGLVVQTFLDAAVSAGSDYISITDHGFSDGQQVRLSSTGSLPGALDASVTYWVVQSTSSLIYLSLTRGGSLFNITGTAGSGTHTISVVPTIPHSFRKVLFYAAAHFIAVDKSDSRSDYYFRVTQATLQAMVQAQRRAKTNASKNKGVLLTRQDSKASRSSLFDRIPWGTT